MPGEADEVKNEMIEVEFADDDGDCEDLQEPDGNFLRLNKDKYLSEVHDPDPSQSNYNQRGGRQSFQTKLKGLNSTLFSITERDMQSEVTSINDARHRSFKASRYNLNETAETSSNN